jgi:flavin-binding protein dodecin
VSEGRFTPNSLRDYFSLLTLRRKTMSGDSIYRITEIIGTSQTSWEDAARNAVETASKTLRDLRVAEIVKLDMVIEDGKVVAFRARVNLSFKYETEGK